MSVSIGMDEWIAELEKHQSHSDDGQTAGEFAAALGTNIDRVRKLLHAAQREGRLIVGSRSAISLSGRNFPQVVYRITPKGKRRK